MKVSPTMYPPGTFDPTNAFRPWGMLLVRLSTVCLRLPEIATAKNA